jgi:hypothetical protein
LDFSWASTRFHFVEMISRKDSTTFRHAPFTLHNYYRFGFLFMM